LKIYPGQNILWFGLYAKELFCSDSQNHRITEVGKDF